VGKVGVNCRLRPPAGSINVSPEVCECFENSSYIIRLLSVLLSLQMHQNTSQLLRGRGGGNAPLPMPAGALGSTPFSDSYTGFLFNKRASVCVAGTGSCCNNEGRQTRHQKVGVRLVRELLQKHCYTSCISALHDTSQNNTTVMWRNALPV